MIPLTVLSSDPGGSDRLAAQICAAPIPPDPPVGSYPWLLGPTSAHLRLSAACTSDCVYCERASWNSGDKAPEKDMTWDVWETVRDKFLLHKMSTLTGIELAGLGEPTMSPLFPRIAKEVLGLNRILFFPTNGHLLNLEKVWGSLGDGTNVRCSVSLDAHDDDSYVAIGRGKAGMWDKVLSNIREIKKRCPKITLVSQFTANANNISSLVPLMPIFCDLGFEEVLFRLSQNHEQAREAVSLTFMRDATESALNQAWQIAEDHNAAHPDQPKLNFIAERRPYAEGEMANSLMQPESVKNSPTEKLKRYLSFAPMDVANCTGNCVTSTTNSAIPVTVTVPSGTVTSTFISTGTLASTHINCTGPQGYCVTDTFYSTQYLGPVFFPGGGGNGFTTAPGYGSFYSLTCVLATTVDSTVINCTTLSSSGAQYDVFNPPGSTQFNISPYSSYTTTCQTNTYACPTNTSFTATDQFGEPTQFNTQIYNCNGSCTSQTLIVTSISNAQTYSFTNKNAVGPNGSPGNCVQPMSGDGPEIVRTVKVPRRAAAPPGAMQPGSMQADSIMQAESVEQPEAAGKTIHPTDASLIMWADGTITSCFAKHVLGNIDDDDYQSILLNPRAQAFWQNRSMGDVTREPWCRACPRNW